MTDGADTDDRGDTDARVVNCRRKVRFSRQSFAEEAVKIYAPKWNMRTYWCDVCGGWHLTKGPGQYE